jgi:hypothetical protein
MTLEEAIGLVMADLGNIRVPVAETEISSGIKAAIANLGECIKAIRENAAQGGPDGTAEPEGGGADV